MGKSSLVQLSRLILPVVLAAVSGCSSTMLAGAAAPAPSAAKPAYPAHPIQTTIKTVTLQALDDPRPSLAKRSVYFDFDSFLIHDSERPLIEAHAKYLASNRTSKGRIEGNSDERGSWEYNLALGQKRVHAVLASLRLIGAPVGEMEAISFGEEKPADPGHDEAARARNRRADLIYVSR
jgi:peptidoglycan-associated lipoprotein